MSRPHVHATLSDGTVISGSPDVVASSVAHDRSMQAREREWVAVLRARGVKAAHPDDGWVNRERSTIHLCYPQFNDGLEVGDLLALGSIYWNGPTRIVRVTGFSANRFAIDGDRECWYVHFEAVPNSDASRRS